jgi:hypothetical protein
MQGMEPKEKCLQPLRVLIANGDVKGIELAERAVDDYLAGFPNLDLKAGALHVLQQEVTALWQKSSGAQVDFANLVFDCIDNRMRALNERHEA